MCSGVHKDGTQLEQNETWWELSGQWEKNKTVGDSSVHIKVPF